MKVKELLSDKSKWTQKVGARDKEGKEVPYTNPSAFSFCLLGAICLCYEEALWRSIAVQIEKNLDIQFVSIWNDRPERTFEEVKALVEELDI